MNFEAWTVDSNGLKATHECGFSIEIEGNPKDPSAVNPGRFPNELSGIEQARLLRHGMEALAAAAKAQGFSACAKDSQGRAPVTKKKPSYTPPANKPKRPVLSLKKRAQEEV